MVNREISRPVLQSGRPAIGYWQSPGRVNLIGEYTDYNLGFVLPFAIDRRVFVAVAKSNEPGVTIRSERKNSVVSRKYSSLRRNEPVTWASYVLGVIWAFHQSGISLPGLEVSLDSDIPPGAGLSSSAAIEAAVAVAINDITSTGLSRLHLAKLCHVAETEYVGIPVGIMDQMAVVNGRSRHAMLIDCRDESVVQVPLNVEQIMVIDTRVRHSNKDGRYAQKRERCAWAVSQLGVSSLREANLTMVDDALEGESRRIARHVVTENDRVLETVNRLSNGESIGDLLVSSHRSLQYDFDVSCQELDCIVDVAMANGADGARMFGAGLGGCAIMIADDPPRIVTLVEKEFYRHGYRPPRSFGVIASDGAGAV